MATELSCSFLWVIQVAMAMVSLPIITSKMMTWKLESLSLCMYGVRS